MNRHSDSQITTFALWVSTSTAAFGQDYVATRAGARVLYAAHEARRES